MQKIATELQEEIYKKYKKGMKKCDLAVLYGLTWTRIDQIIKRTEKIHTNPNIKEKLWIAYPDVDRNIYKAMDNVNLECVLGVKKHGEYTSFLDHYDDEK